MRIKSFINIKLNERKIKKSNSRSLSSFEEVGREDIYFFIFIFFPLELHKFNQSSKYL